MEFTKFNGKWQDGGGQPWPTFPLLKNGRDDEIPRVVAEEAYKEYAAQYGTGQTLERLAERGGFGSSELAILLFKRCQRLSGVEV